jgi:zinc protease
MTKPNYPNPTTIHRTVLDNGLTVLIYENHSAPSVEIEGVIRAGALGDAQSKAGLAQFTAAGLMRGTANRSFETIYEDLESVGASLGFSSGRHTAGFSGRSLAEDLDLLLAVTADALRHPTFPADHMERLRGEMITGLQMAANDTRSQASKAFRKLIYPDHLYGVPVSGDVESIAGISPDDLHQFHQTYYGTQNAIITIVGDVNADEALAKVKNVLGDWKNDGQQALPNVPAISRPPEVIRTHVAMPGKTQSDIVLGLPGPARSAPDYLDVSVANVILGQFGMYGRLGKTVREAQGLAYYVYSNVGGGLGPNPWAVGTGVAPDKVDQAISSIQDEIRRIQNELVPVDEVEDTKAYLTGSLPVNLETNDGLSSHISDMEFYNLGLDYLQRYPDDVRAITPERVQAAAQKYFSADEIGIAVAGP